jgi:DNA-binding NarL/FixJ family response regulator
MSTANGNRLMHCHRKTKQQLLAIIVLHVDGKSLAQIADATGISKSTIHRVLNQILANQPKLQEAI